MHATIAGPATAAVARRSTPRRRLRLLSMVVGIGAALAGGTVTSASTPPTTPPEAAEPVAPTDLGDDPAFDALAEACFSGDLQSCDDLYWRTESGSAYEEYGSTCAGRLPEPTFGDCADTLGAADPSDPSDPADPADPAVDAPVMPPPTQEPTGLGTDPDLDALAADCYAGAPFACDKLFVLGEEGTPYYTYGYTCAGRQAEDATLFCHELVGFPPPGIDFATLETPDDDNVYALVASCIIGDMQACDDLYRQVDSTSPYHGLADSCAGRQAEDTGVLCTNAFPDWEQLLVVPESSEPTGPSTSDPAVDPAISTAEPTDPTVLGDDPTFDAMAQACFDGDFVSCDDLYWRSPLGSDYEAYGATCGGRATDRVNGACADSFTTTEPAVTGLPAATVEPTGLGSDPAFDALAQDCYDGAMFACDKLYFDTDAEADAAYSEYADTCAGRQATGTNKYCHELAGFPAPTATLADLPTDDPKLFLDASLCVIGDMVACDDVYRAVPEDSPFREFGDTCAGRQELGTGTLCTQAFPEYELLYETTGATTDTTDPGPSTTEAGTTPGSLPAPTMEPTGLGSDAGLNALAQSCYDGDMEACDQMFATAFENEAGETYIGYADTCAGRQERGTGELCTETFG